MHCTPPAIGCCSFWEEAVHSLTKRNKITEAIDDVRKIRSTFAMFLSTFVVLMGFAILGNAQAQETLEELKMDRVTKTTSTEWRDDDVNIQGVRELNRVYERIPFSREYEGVLDVPPLKLEWSTGANLPVAWKGGVAGRFDDTIVLAGGMWMPGRLNVAYAYDIRTDGYAELPPCPVDT